MAEAVRTLGELAIGPTSARVDIGRLAGAPCFEIALDDVGGEVVAARDRVEGRARIDARRKFRGGIDHRAFPQIARPASNEVFFGRIMQAAAECRNEKLAIIAATPR